MADDSPEKVPEAAVEGEGPGASPLLTRENLLSGRIAEMVRGIDGARLLSDAARDQSLAETLAARPPGAKQAWLFAYGSLIWNPLIRYEESRRAAIRGWQRAFCLQTPAGRGTPENPGLVLALDQGGACEGIAFRIAEDVLEEELAIVWRREMLTGAYIPHWLPLHDEAGQVFGHGISFSINREGPQYVDLPEEQVVQRLATARGALGSSAEYLFQTRDGLRTLGIQDPLIESLSGAVTALQAG